MIIITSGSNKADNTYTFRSPLFAIISQFPEFCTVYRCKIIQWFTLDRSILSLRLIFKTESGKYGPILRFQVKAS